MIIVGVILLILGLLLPALHVLLWIGIVLLVIGVVLTSQDSPVVRSAAGSTTADRLLP